MRTLRGFTLVELMIVVVVLAIIVAVAVPSYQEQARKSRRADAKVALTTAVQLMERYYTENARYTTTATAPFTCGITLPIASPKGYYSVSGCTATTANTFTLTAAPSVADPACGSFTITNAGTQGVTGTAGAAACW
ncbi:MAG TPA: type IV pilin protein [Rhodocyclaceae bacterium]